MDKTIEVILFFTLAIIIGALLITLSRGKIKGFGDFIGDRNSQAKCKIEKVDYKSQIKCQKNDDGTIEATEPENFDWPKKCGSPPDAQKVCENRLGGSSSG